MNEYTLQVIVICKLLWVVGFAALYSFGGISNKWLRRYLGAAWMWLGIFGFSVQSGSFYWWYLLYPLLLSISLSLGYGGEIVTVKLRKRFIYSLALSLSALPLCYPNHYFGLFGFHCILCIVSSVALGVFGITKHARSEEAIIALLSTVCVLFLI